MKKIAIIIGIAAIVTSCNNANKQQVNSKSQLTENSVKVKQDTIDNTQNANTFNIENIAFSTAEIGEFPFLTLPKGLKSTNKPLERKFDVCFFPINGVMTPFEGRMYKIFVSNESGKEYSKHYFEKSMEEYLLSIGAVKIYDGEITKEEYDRYNKLDPNKGADGDIGYTGENIKFFVIRSKDIGNIYVQFTSNNSSGKINVLIQEAFQQTITRVTADDISKDLNENGKSILYVNFDVDESNITTDGKEIITQIARALQNDKSLKISINGHTDNTGDKSHNKKLSTDRAYAVLYALVSNEIDKTRLTAKGYGSEIPLVANNSDENKAKNRRVELVKIN